MNLKLKNVGNAVKLAFGKTSLWTKRNSPKLLIAGSVVAGATAIVLACKATKKVDKAIEPELNKIADMHKDMKDDNKVTNGICDIKITKQRIAKEYFKAGIKIIKIYTPTACMFGLSVIAMLGSHKIMQGRNLALATAMTTLEESFTNYRQRVAKILGVDEEKKLFQNYTEGLKTTDKDGKEIIIEEAGPKPVADDPRFCWFDESCPDWTKNAQMNFDFLVGAQRYFNQLLIARGYVFLNEIYEYLHVDPGTITDNKLMITRYLGWVYDKDNTNGGDNFISFGISDDYGNALKTTKDTLRGERNILLEFNYDGDILTDNSKRKFTKALKAKAC